MLRRIFLCLSGLSVFFVLFVFVLAIKDCGYEETKECELISIRRYCVAEEYGIFSKKTDYEWHIEYIYKTNEETVVEKYSEQFVDIYISDESKIVMEEGYSFPDIYITLEKYNELYEVEVE